MTDSKFRSHPSSPRNDDRRPPRQDGRKPSDRPAQRGADRKSFRGPQDRPARPGADRRSFRGPHDRPARETVSPARAAAYRAIVDVLEHEAYTAMAVNRVLSETTMSAADRGLCTALTYGTLENLLCIDHILSSYLEDMSGLDPHALIILRMAICQKNWMDRIPDNAIADEAVKLARSVGLESMTGLVNGVIRAFLRNEKEITWPEDEFERLALTRSVPLWLARQLETHYGKEDAVKMLEYRPTEHGIVLRPNMMQLNDQAFQQLLDKKAWAVRPGHVPHAWYADGVMQLSRDTDYRNGMFSVQGEASMTCAELTGVKPGMQVLDCCAAPGGKTAYMAEMMQGTGRIFALGVHPHRVALLEAAVKRLRLDNVRPQLYDATRFKEDWTERFDVCLLDAPCTGLGEWHQKPDIVFGMTPESVTGLTAVQQALLDNCARYVRRGGRLVYATSSILPEENEMQVRAFLERHPEYAAEEIPASIRALYPAGARPGSLGLQLLPGLDGDEGFYMAALKRKG